MFGSFLSPVVVTDFYALDSGSPLAFSFDDLRLKMTRFEYDEDIEKIGQLTMAFEDPTGALAEDERLKGRGKLIRVRWGYLTYLSAPKSCVVRYTEPSYQPNGQQTLVVYAWDGASRALLGAHPRNWGMVETSTIARKIAERWGLFPIIPEPSDDVRRFPYMQSGKFTDLQYLKALAKRRGWECWADGINLYYGPDRHDEAPVISAVYKASAYPALFGGVPLVMTSFSPKVDQAARPSTALEGVDGTAKGPASGKADDMTAGGGLAERNSLGRKLVVNLNDRSMEYKNIPEAEREAGGGVVGGTAEGSPSQVQKDAEAAQWLIARSALSATASITPGNPDVRVRRTMDIQGVAPTYAGKWRIVKARHSITVAGQSVYAVEASLQRSGTDAASGDDAANPNKTNPDGSSADAVAEKTVKINLETREVVR